MTYLPIIQALKGGRGSGNFGHAGIPGKVGGSKPGGGSGSRAELLNGVYPKPAAKGLYEAKHIPVIDNLSYNSKREYLATEAFRSICDLTSRYPKLKNKIRSIELIGGFTSNQEFPKDFDMLVEFADDKSVQYFYNTVQPAIIHSYSRVEHIAWSKDNAKAVEGAEEYRVENSKRYNTEPINLSSWLE